MRVALNFRLYMMRYGVALLAASIANSARPTFDEVIRDKLVRFLTESSELNGDDLSRYKSYLKHKPGSPRYTPHRQKLKRGESVAVERQDLLLSDPSLPSSVGALTQDYFDDAITLAHKLKLVTKGQNMLMARGRLSLSTGWSSTDPFKLSKADALYLGLWLLDVDCDWIWAFLKQLPVSSDFEITVENRTQLLMESWKCLLSARELRSTQAQVLEIRSRLQELVRITERNLATKLNMGQPWSWFLIPRLELLVDAGLLGKRERHGLSRYFLTAVGTKFGDVCHQNKNGEALLQNYFSCQACAMRPLVEQIEWSEVREYLGDISRVLATSVGYMPILETSAALCVKKLLNNSDHREVIWEIEKVKESLGRESKSSRSEVRLGIDRRGKIYAFKLVDISR